MNKYITEFIGTYFLVLTIGLTVVPGAGDLVTPLAIGAVLAAMIYAGGHISNAHYNPAITIAFWIRGRCETKDIAPYFIAQLIAASAAAATTSFLVGTGTPIPIKDVPSAFVAEFIFTFALAFVILNVATAKRTAGNSYYGIAIGLVVVAGIFAVGKISGAAFNPAVAAGAAIMNLIDAGDITIHLVADFAGAAVAAGVFRGVHPDDH